MQARPLFPETSTYPQFFTRNLVDPKRVMKLVTGKQAGVRAFYFQLLKMVFEIEVQRAGQEVDYAAIFTDFIAQTITQCRSAFQLGPLRSSSQIITQFLNNSSNAEFVGFEEYINQHLEVDVALVSIFNEFLKQRGVLDGEVEQVFGILSEAFDQRAVQVEKCVKFEQSDVFVYIQNDSTLYLAFLRLDEDSQNENSMERVISHSGNTKNSIKQGKNDTIMNMFGDMLQSSKNDLDSKGSNSFAFQANSGHSPGNKQQSGNIYMNVNKIDEQSFKKGRKIEEFPDYEPNKDNNKFMKDQSKVQNYKLNQAGTTAKPSVRFAEPDDLIYRPSSYYRPSLQSISQVTSSKQSLLYSKRQKKDPLDCAEEQEKGTFYRQFTDTRILNILPEPHRSTVKMLKNRFIGVHGRNTITKL